MDGRVVGSLDYSSLERGDEEAGAFITQELQKLTGAENLYLCKTAHGDPMGLKELECFNEPTVTNKDGREWLLSFFFRRGAVNFE